jgi:ABC-type uncharacterized transport system ATPase component
MLEENLALAMKRGHKRGFSLGVKSKDRSYFQEQLAVPILGSWKTRLIFFERRVTECLVISSPFKNICPLALAMKRGHKRGFSLGVKSKDRSYFQEQLAMLNLNLENRLDAEIHG